MTYRFGPFRADRTTYRVFRGDRALDLTPKLLDLLFHLLERPAALVTKEALLEAVWPGANVTDNALAQAISELREALGDAAASPTYIRTVARRGYRFVAPVSVEGHPTAAPEAPAAPPGDTPTLAVLDFENMTHDPDVAWLGAGIAETVTSDLASLGRFRVIDRWRVVEAARHTTGSSADVAAALGVHLLVIGSYQRSGPDLRITARMVDCAGGTALADAKVDGGLLDVFALQDGITRAFARALGAAAPAQPARAPARETASLEAYRAYTEGWLTVESLDTERIGDAVRSFERAIERDPGYGMAFTGLANAEFVAYEMTRADRAPNARSLSAGIAHARQAVAVDDGLAEAHATLSFLLTSAGQFDPARQAAERAVALEPDNWRHHYRLGHAAWGETRARALSRALELYPQFAYATFELAMLLVARGELERADALVRQGVRSQDRPERSGDRFPAIGFHWLLGSIEAARGRPDAALAEFDREIAQLDPRRLYAREYAALTRVSRGHLRLEAGHCETAAADFDDALAHVPGYPGAQLGLMMVDPGPRARTHKPAELLAEVRRASLDLAAQRRWQEASYVDACAAAAEGDPAGAVTHLTRLLDVDPPSFLGWTIPIEPVFGRLKADPGFARVLARLAERAK